MPPTGSIAVRELCEFTAKSGDLDLRFTPAPGALEGIAGHGLVAARRGAGWQREVALEGLHEGELKVRGRADGFDAARNRLEEIKTHVGDLSRLPDNHRALHWAQLKIYGALLCREKNLEQVELTLTYFDIRRETETSFSERHTAEALEQFFAAHCGRYLDWAKAQAAHRGARNAALATTRFPHPELYAGQRQLAEAVYRTALRNGRLLAQAPTGIGKTIGALFPLLKAAVRGEIDKVFYLTAKTSGRRLALDALQALFAAEPALPLRVLELVARDKACEHPDKACHGASCPLAQGFYDRLPAAREAALAGRWLDQASVRTAALRHQVCPYYLSQDLVRGSDVVVGDYNYWFDGSALLHGLTQVNEWRIALLVDEAHNLVDRGRAMYSAALDPQPFAEARRAAPPALRKALAGVSRAWNLLHREQTEAYAVHPAPPSRLVEALKDAIAAIGDHLAENPTGIDAAVQRFQFDALHFVRLAEAFGAHSLFDVTRDAGHGAGSVLCIRNVIPAPFLAPRFAAAASAVLFSATLSPAPYYRDLLGLPAEAPWLDVPSPFAPEQLSLHLVERIPTRYQHRQRSLAPIADLIAAQYLAQPGNYLAFFSSYDYLERAAAALAERHPRIPAWRQDRRMNEAERSAFLERLTLASRGVHFAVLGSAFAEGIDLPGERLIGAFVVTLGMPQRNPVNEQIRLRMAALFGSGFEYAYLYPGLQKVVQAAGRVIRTRQDRGVVYLIDERYGDAAIRALLPRWWRLPAAGSSGSEQVKTAIELAPFRHV